MHNLKQCRHEMHATTLHPKYVEITHTPEPKMANKSSADADGSAQDSRQVPTDTHPPNELLESKPGLLGLQHPAPSVCCTSQHKLWPKLRVCLGIIIKS